MLNIKSVLPIILMFTFVLNIGINSIYVIHKNLNCEIVATNFEQEVDVDEEETLNYFEAIRLILNPPNFSKRCVLSGVSYASNPLKSLKTPPPELA